MIHLVTDENFPLMSARMEESYRRSRRRGENWRDRLRALFHEVDACSAQLRARDGMDFSALFVLQVGEGGGVHSTRRRRRPDMNSSDARPSTGIVARRSPAQADKTPLVRAGKNPGATRKRKTLRANPI